MALQIVVQVRHLYLKSESAAPYRHRGEPFQMFQMFQMFQNLERSKIWRCLAGVVRTGLRLIHLALKETPTVRP